MANDENKIILEFPATNVEIEFGETITFDNISGFLNSDRVTYNGESLTEEIAHLEDDKADTTHVDEQLELKADKATTYTKTQSDNRYLGKTNPSGTGYFSLNRRGSTGAYSVSVGWHNEASAESSFAEGENNASSGYASHSEGYGNAASGLMAHAEGVTTESSGYGSHSEGVGTIAKHIGQHVFGAYNVADPSTAQPTAKGNYIEIVGNGTDDNRRKNARTLDWSGNETLMGDLTYNGNKSLTSEISRLDGKIDNLPAPMIFKGTLGVGGTIQTLPAASASNEGYTYKVITDGTYAGQTAKVGDVFTSNGSDWVLIPSGDEDNDTWRAIKVNGVEKLGNGISSGAVDFVGSENIEVDFDGNGNKVSVKTKNIYTKTEVDDIVYNILPDDTASGSVANFETDLALPLKSLKIDVNAKQDLHGYDYPWTAGNGKNLCPPMSEFSANGLTTTVDSDGKITVSGTATGTGGYLTSFIDLAKIIPSGTAFSISVTNAPPSNLRTFFDEGIGDISSGATQSNNIIRNIDITKLRLYLFTTAGQTYNFSFYYQIEIGSSATPWTPYENICPIEGWSEITLDANGTTEVINLGGTYYGGHFTQDKDGHRQFEVTHSELLDMGDIVWVSFDPTNRIYRANQLPNCKAPVSTTDRRNGFMCTNYPASANVSLNENMTDKSLLRYNGWIILRDTSFSNYTEVAEGVRGAKLFYELATPYYIDLPDGEPITTLVGTNNIYADTGDTSVVFKDSVNGYVEKKIASVQALALNT